MPTQAERLEAVKKRTREAAILFEHKDSKLVDIRDVPAVVRSLGVNPTGVQITQIVDQLQTLNADGDNINLLPVDMVEGVVSTFLIKEEGALFRDDYHTLIRAFRAFDPEGKGYIDAEQMRTYMTTRGEPMTEDEVNKMLVYAADPETGRIFYEDYAAKLCNDGRMI